MSKIKNYVKATAYKVAVLLDLVDNNQKMKDGTTISLVKEGNMINDSNVPINLVFNKNDDGTAIFVDGFLNSTAISTAHLYTNMNILENAIEIIGTRVTPSGDYFSLTFNDIANAPATNITEWNSFFTIPPNADTEFTQYEILNNSVLLYGPSALTLKQYLFYNNTAITSVSLTNVDVVGNYVFYNSTSLSNVTFLSASTIGTASFLYCISLSSATFPLVTTIGGDAFANCASLSYVIIPLATTISTYSFYNCISLSSITCPQVSIIDGNAFDTCTSLSSVTFLLASTIGDWAFSNCTNLSSVILPSALSIGEKSFNGCTSMVHINLSSCTSIGDKAFFGISGKTIDMWIPLTTIGEPGFGTFFTDNTVHLNP